MRRPSGFAVALDIIETWGSSEISGLHPSALHHKHVFECWLRLVASKWQAFKIRATASIEQIEEQLDHQVVREFVSMVCQGLYM